MHAEAPGPPAPGPPAPSATKPPKYERAGPLESFSVKAGASKYDYVKVRVHLEEGHYYVLSRFLLSRMLSVTMIRHEDAIRISLKLKKMLVDLGKLDVNQEDFEKHLFDVMQQQGYGAEFIRRFRMMTAFHHQRVPLIVLLAGTGCLGKSTLAMALAERLNLPNVLNTDMVYELISAVVPQFRPQPLWERAFESQEAMLEEYRRECRVVRTGVEGDIRKSLKEGKALIIEGFHIDPALYLPPPPPPGPASPPQPAPQSAPQPASQPAGAAGAGEEGGGDGGGEGGPWPPLEGVRRLLSRVARLVPALLPDPDPAPTPPRPRRLRPRPGPPPPAPAEAPRPGGSGRGEGRGDGAPRGIVIPFVLTLPEEEHRILLDSAAGAWGGGASEASFGCLRGVQEYLVGSAGRGPGAAVVEVRPHDLQGTLDALHAAVLRRIELLCPAPAPAPPRPPRPRTTPPPARPRHTSPAPPPREPRSGDSCRQRSLGGNSLK
eukprot:tig00001376_g8545.t1